MKKRSLSAGLGRCPTRAAKEAKNKGQKDITTMDNPEINKSFSKISSRIYTSGISLERSVQFMYMPGFSTNATHKARVMISFSRSGFQEGTTSIVSSALVPKGWSHLRVIAEWEC
jgi:hypothetical protein